jgi:uncharacterized protein YjbI with pentapeptide repeats
MSGWQWMALSSPKCNTPMHDGRECGRDVLRDGLCIFHLAGKDAAEISQFKKALLEYLDESIKREQDEIDFTEFVFQDYVQFSSQTSPKHYRQKLIFEHAKIEGSLSFAYAVFTGEVVFASACFSGSGILDLSFTVFDESSRLVLSEAHLSGQSSVSLFKATFLRNSKGPNFTRAVFMDKASISLSRGKFECALLDFTKAVFQDESVALLSFARFVGARLNFASVVFRDKATLEIMTTAMHDAEVYFLNASFESASRFSLTYTNLYAGTTLDFSDAVLGEGSFQWVRIDKDVKVTFGSFSRAHPQDLSEVSFLHTDVRQIEFGNVKWGASPQGSVVDEHFLEERDGPPYQAVVTLYRRLRKNYELQLRYSEASSFFIREMELLRTKPSHMGDALFSRTRFAAWLRSWVSIGAVYYILAKYGEDYIWTIAWSITSIFLIYPLVRLTMQCSNTCSQIYCVMSNYSVAVQKAVRLFFQVFELPNLDFTDTIFRLWSALLLAVLFIALKRKFERRT